MKFLAFILFLFLISCATSEPPTPTITPTPRWFEGGNLHNATVLEWELGSQRNKLATAADWVTVAIKPDTLDETRTIAEEVVTCIDGVTDVSPHEMKATDLAASCLVLMGYQSNE